MKNAAFEPRLPKLTDVAAFLVPFAAYANSLSPWPQSWDYAEMQTVPYILGIPHATGFPAFVLAGWLFTHVVAIGTVAWRMNLFCALFVAGSALLTKRLAVAFGAGDVPALAASLVFAFSSVMWTKASHTDVHGLALFASLATFNFAMAFARDRRWQTLCVAAACFGLGLAAHPNVLWSGLALVPGMATVARSSLRRGALVVAVAIAPLALYAYLPLRSAVVESAGLDPAAAAPFAGHGEVDWDTNRPSTLAGFVVETTGSEFRATDSLGAVVKIWRYPAVLARWFDDAATQLGVATLLLAAIGSYAASRAGTRSRATTWVVLGAGAAIPFAYSYPVETDLSRYVLASLAVASALAATANRAFARAPFVTTSLLVVGLAVLAVANYDRNVAFYGWSNDRGSQPVIDAVRASVPDGAVVLSHWIDGTGLAYAAYVDRSMGDRVLLLWRSADVERYGTWRAGRRVFVLTNFAIAGEVRRLIRSRCLAERSYADGGADHHLYEVTCASGLAALP